MASEPYCRSMPNRLSDEDVSRQILGVFMRHRIPATGTLQRNYFFEVRDADFQRGINKAVANNWITVDLRNRYRYQLTTTGYAAGRVSIRSSERRTGGVSALVGYYSRSSSGRQTRCNWPTLSPSHANNSLSHKTHLKGRASLEGPLVSITS